MKKKYIKHILKLNKNGFITGISLFIIALCSIPIAIKNSAVVFCIGQTSNKVWLQENNHSEANMIAVQRCLG
tara:strand:+ start:341 stop:556 length:216 start_codon:yes stop_codon:yes gene_type:complete